MRKLAALTVLLTVLCGCGSAGGTFAGTSGAPLAGGVSPASSASPDLTGRSVLAANAGTTATAAVDGLGPSRARQVYQKVALFNDADVARTGTVVQACQAIVALSANPALGAPAVYGLLAPLASDDSGQSLLVSAAATLGPPIDSGLARVQDAVSAASATQVTSGRNPEVTTLLSPAISSMPKFHALRELAPAAVPAGQRAALRVLRDSLSYPGNGTLIQKIVKTTVITKYLDGTFDPIASGFHAVYSDVSMLITPPQIIEGLRLDYPGGFQNETQVGAVVIAQDDSFRLTPPYGPPNGGTVISPYPFTGNGFTATVRANAIPEWVMPPSGLRMKPGAQLFLIDAQGNRTLQGTFNGTRWDRPGGGASKTVVRAEVRRPATYRGVPVFVQSRDDVSYHVSVAQEIDPSLLLDADKLGPCDWRGRILLTDPALVF